MNFSALPRRKAGHSGQAILVILLVMVVGLTMGLSLATRSVTDLKISGQSEASAKAFSAAEAGIEAVLRGDDPASITVATVTKTTAGGSDSPFSPGNINIADTYTVWLVGHNSSGDLDLTASYSGNSLDVCWQKTDPASAEPALEISVLYKDGAAYKVWRGAYDPDAVRAGTKNNFSSGVSGILCNAVTQNKVTVNLAGLGTTRIALRLRPFYAQTSLTVIPLAGNNLPTQGLTITSAGTSGQTTRKVMVTQSYNSLPSIFDNVLFSGKDLLK